MRFRDHRITVTKRQPAEFVRLPIEDWPPGFCPTPRRVAPPDRHPDNLMPTHNRASRRAHGRYATYRRGATRRMRRALLRTGYRPGA